MSTPGKFAPFLKWLHDTAIAVTALLALAAAAVGLVGLVALLFWLDHLRFTI